MQGLNSVSPLPGGGFVTANFAARGGNAVAAAVWRTLKVRIDTDRWLDPQAAPELDL
jgi:hypothetical protein